MITRESKNIFITGATGFLGSHLLHTLLTSGSHNIYILVRAQKGKSASERKDELLKDAFPQLAQKGISSRIHLLAGDVSRENLGIRKEELLRLADTIDIVFHCAAICDFGYELNAIRSVNVEGTRNVLKVALAWKQKGRLEYVNHISTAYVAGSRNGIFYEKQQEPPEHFNNTYEQSKFEAEQLVYEYRSKGLPADIFRPSIISHTFPARIVFMPGPLRFLSVFTLGLFDKIPARIHAELNIIPVDIVAGAIALIAGTKEKPINQNYHMVNPRSISFGALIDSASEVFGFKKPKCIPATKFPVSDLTAVQQKLIQVFVPYLNQRLTFDMRNTLSMLKPYGFRIPAIDKRMMKKMFQHYKTTGALAKKELPCY